jgi:hypothetical protein
MKAFIGAKIFYPDGTLFEKRDFQEAHSFTINFLKGLFEYMANAAIIAFDTANSSQTMPAQYAPFQLTAAANATTTGILIGSGTNPNTLTDYNLQTQITANVYHNAMNFFINCPSASAAELIINRTFLNNTGSALTINEVGLFGLNSGIAKIFLLDRTLFTIVVPAGLAITLTYKIGISL